MCFDGLLSYNVNYTIIIIPELKGKVIHLQYFDEWFYLHHFWTKHALQYIIKYLAKRSN